MTWVFTFGSGQKNAGHFVRISGTADEAREEMFARYGKEWAFQYSEDEWSDWCERAKTYGVPIETELK